MTIINKTLAENIVGWAQMPTSFDFDGNRWSAEWTDEEQEEIHVWGVEISSGVRWYETTVSLPNGRDGGAIELIQFVSGNWETIEEAFTSPAAA